MPAHPIPSSVRENFIDRCEARCRELSDYYRERGFPVVVWFDDSSVSADCEGGEWVYAVCETEFRGVTCAEAWAYAFKWLWQMCQSMMTELE